MELGENNFVWFNGEIMPHNEAKVSVFTHALHYGTSVFEGARIYDGVAFKMNEHSERLVNSGVLSDIVIPFDVATLNEATKQIIAKNGLKSGYLRTLAFKGDDGLGVYSADNRVHVLIACWEWPAYYGDDTLSKGIKLTYSNFVKPDPRSVNTAAKAGGFYHIGSIIKNDASRRGFADALLLDTEGFVAETTSSNIFFVKDGEVHTPTPNCFLNGITRQTVIELCAKMGIVCHERKILAGELSSFDEAFVTGSAAEITPVGEIYGYKYSVSLSLKIRDEYLKLVGATA